MFRGLLILGLMSSTAFAAEEPSPQKAIERGLGYLAREVPAWRPKNKCFSCHNNGDAARALLAAKRRKFRVPDKSLADTLDWLAQPDRWEHNGGEGEFNDKQLAAIQFGYALADVISHGESRAKNGLQKAAKLVAGFQKPDGAWHVIAAGSLGSPITYGNILATAHARRVLQTADAKRYHEPIAKADRWLRSQRPKNVFAAAAILIGLENAADEKAAALRKDCLAIIAKGQDKTGGWGPYTSSVPEPFDTALVLIALSRLPEKPHGKDLQTMQSRGRKALIALQNADGSWLETTRPENSVSYAHRVSTTGWCLQALLAGESGKSPKSREKR